MKRISTLICLVSEQRMQNLIPLFQRTLHYDRVVLVASAEGDGINPRFMRIAQDLKAALHNRVQWQVWHRPVDPMDPAQTLAVCKDIIFTFGGLGSVTINFTGGTKPMSIGAYQAGLNAGCEILYVDTQKEQIFRYQNGIPCAEPFQLDRITVAQVLTAHGKPINQNWTSTKQPSFVERKITEEIYRTRLQSLPQIILMQKQLRPIPFDSSQEKTIAEESVRKFGELIDLFEQFGELRREGSWIKVSQRMARYFEGNWLEQYVGYALEKDGRFDDVAGNLQLAGIENELDVACTLNGKLAIVECKSGKIEGGEGSSIINRLRALKDSIAGTFGKTILVTCYETNRLSQKFLDRAGEYVSRVVGLGDLAEVERVIYEEVSQKKR